MQLTPLIAVHMTAALTAICIGPIALWARKGSTPQNQRPKLHRAFGYAWVTLMLTAAVSAIFIRDYSLPNIAGYTPIHLLIPATLITLFKAFQSLLAGTLQVIAVRCNVVMSVPAWLRVPSHCCHKGTWVILSGSSG